MKEYWFCTIGPIERGKLIPGDDLPLRQSVKNTYEKMTGDIKYQCASGWGVTEDMETAMFYARLYPKEIIEYIEKGEK